MIPAPRPFPDGPDRDPSPLGDVAAMTLPDLRHQRRLLGDELRGLRYARRITQAQTDLIIASLLRTDPGDIEGTPGHGGDAGARLLALRERTRAMAVHEQALRRDLDRVTKELAQRVVATVRA